MATLASATSRKQIATDSAVHKASQSYIDAAAVAQKDAVEKHWWGVIERWVNLTDLDDPDADGSTLDLPIVGQVAEATLTAWEATLTASGYSCSQSGRVFTIVASLPL